MNLASVYSLLLLIGLVRSNPCTEIESVVIENGKEDSSGAMVVNGVIYPSGTWYKEEVNGTEITYGCPCVDRLCLWKCCGINQAYLQKECLDTDLASVNPFNPQLYSDQKPSTVSASETFLYMHNTLCSQKYLVDTNYDELYIQEDGSLIEISDNEELIHSPTQYCVDMRQENKTGPARLVATVCFPNEDEVDDNKLLYTVYAIGLILSVPFLVMTFAVYAFVPELRNLHGLCLMAYCAGLIVAYPLLAYLKLNVGTIGLLGSSCVAIGFLVYFSLQTSFFWLNVMCFDIWKTFSGYRHGVNSKRQALRRFMLYGLYAWGVPLILTAFSVTMQLVDLPSHIIKPGFANKRCWFQNWISEFVYFFSPFLVLVILNLTFFSITAHRIRSIKQETAILTNKESGRSDKLKGDKQRFKIYFKLFLVMGVTWTIEIISFAVGGSNWYWLLLDFLNVLMGLFVFFIFVWKNKVRQLVIKRINSIRRAGATHETTETRSSTAPTDDTRLSGDDSAIKLEGRTTIE